MNTYLFDIDGVLTNPHTPEIIQPHMIEILTTFLKRGIPMGFISGRPMWWLRDELIKKMEMEVTKENLDKKILDLLYVAGEFGAVTAVHINGEKIEKLDEKYMIPNEIKDKLATYAQSIKDTVFIEKKQTLFTVHRNEGLSQEEFRKVKSEIIAKFKSILQNYPEIEILSDPIAINVRHKKVNKTIATDNFISWLKDKKISPEKFFVFGDSLTDLEMAVELQKQQLPFEFIYVGKEEELNGIQYGFPITVTKAECDEGTIECLTAHTR